MMSSFLTYILLSTAPDVIVRQTFYSWSIAPKSHYYIQRHPRYNSIYSIWVKGKILLPMGNSVRSAHPRGWLITPLQH